MQEPGNAWQVLTAKKAFAGHDIGRHPEDTGVEDLGLGLVVPRPAFASANQALSKWKELTAPRQVLRDPQNIPSGV